MHLEGTYIVRVFSEFETALQHFIRAFHIRKPRGAEALVNRGQGSGRHPAAGRTIAVHQGARVPKCLGTRALTAGHSGHHQGGDTLPVHVSKPRPEDLVIRLSGESRVIVTCAIPPRTPDSAPASVPPGERHAFAGGVALDLVAGDQIDGEIARLGVGEVEAAHRRRRPHGVALRQADAGRLLDAQQSPERSPSRCGRDTTDSRPPGGCRGTSRRSARPSRAARSRP